MSELITTDHPLTDLQQQVLAALLDVIVPESSDGRMPSARELALLPYLIQNAPEFVEPLAGLLDILDENFAVAEFEARLQQVHELSADQPRIFRTLLVQTLSCYYQRPDVRTGLGLEPGAPFPRGNEVEAGDLSLLDPVKQQPRLYRE